MPVRIPKPEALPEVLALLAATPVRLAACARGLSAARLAERPNPKSWSAVEHLAHLRGCDAVWTETIYAMLVEVEPALPLLDPRQWARKLKYDQQHYADLLAAFSARRAELLAVLTPLPLAAWTRGADIGGRRHTVYSQARRLARHESEHCPQVEEGVRT
jgi:hypothetical protein